MTVGRQKPSLASSDRVWKTSSLFCDDGASCVQVHVADESVHIRDSKAVDSSGIAPVQTYSLNEWRSFIAGVKAGEFDL